MPTKQTVLLVGGTGRTGQRVLQQLLSRGIHVRAIARSVQKLPAGAAKNPHPTAWDAWNGKLPGIINAATSKR
jgi:uncharacterized protein YbjT (DUF2867 family)